MRRFVHDFIKWAGPTIFIFCGACVGLVAALAQSYPRVKDWGQLQFDRWWPVVTAPWFLVLSLLLIAIYLWALIWTGQKIGNVDVDATIPSRVVIEQKHQGSGHNIVAETVNLGKQPFLLTDDDLNQIMSQIDPAKPVHLITATDWEMGDRLHKFLADQGVTVANRQKIGLLINIPPYRKPVHIEAKPEGTTLIVLDPS